MHARNDDLRLGIAKARVELQDLGASGGEHEATVEAAAVVDSLGSELGQDAPLGIDHGGKLVVGDDGHRRIDAHTTGVGTTVALEGALVVLGGSKRPQGRAVGKGEQRALGARQHLLHDNRGARVTKGGKALVDAVKGLVKGRGNDDTLACREAIGLDHHGRADLANVSRALVLVGKAPPCRGGNAGALHHTLGELLGALHAGTGLARSKDGDASGADLVGHACHERRLGSDDDQAYALVGRKSGNGVAIAHVYVRTLGHTPHAPVAGCHVESARAGARGDGVEQSVLTAARAQEKDVDGLGHGSS